jgi:hypothetical protein
MLLNEAIEHRARYGQERDGCQRQDPGRARFLLQQRHLAKKLARLHFGEHVLVAIVKRHTDLHAATHHSIERLATCVVLDRHMASRKLLFLQNLDY